MSDSEQGPTQPTLNPTQFVSAASHRQRMQDQAAARRDAQFRSAQARTGTAEQRATADEHRQNLSRMEAEHLARRVAGQQQPASRPAPGPATDNTPQHQPNSYPYGATRSISVPLFGHTGATGGSGRSVPSTGTFSPPAAAHQARVQAANTRSQVQAITNRQAQAPAQQGPGVHALQGALFHHTGGTAANPTFTLNPQAVAPQPAATPSRTAAAGAAAGATIRAAASAAASRTPKPTFRGIAAGVEVLGKVARDVGKRSMAQPSPIPYNNTWRSR